MSFLAESLMRQWIYFCFIFQMFERHVLYVQSLITKWFLEIETRYFHNIPFTNLDKHSLRHESHFPCTNIEKFVPPPTHFGPVLERVLGDFFNFLLHDSIWSCYISKNPEPFHPFVHRQGHGACFRGPKGVPHDRRGRFLTFWREKKMWAKSAFSKWMMRDFQRKVVEIDRSLCLKWGKVFDS